MKPAFIFTLASIAVVGLSSMAHADYWATLAQAQDAIVLKAGETALITSVNQPSVIQYERPGKRPVQHELGGQVYKGVRWQHQYHQSFLHLRGPHGPIAFTGPAKVCLKTTGLVSIQVVQTHSEPVRPHSAPTPATKAALWQSLASR